ncbi:MAG: acyltransferase [Pirellulaceae bacterium]
MSTTNPQLSDISSVSSHSLPYNPALDGLRGLAILLVVLHHSGFARDPDSVGATALSHVKAAGWIGVDFFFVLSGFLITSILIKSFGRPRWLRIFFARRALRVLPLYFLVICGCFNLVTLIPLEGLNWLRDLASDQWWYWLHLANFRKMAGDLDPSMPTVGWMSTYWSLSIEEHFYLVWPLVLLIIGPKRIPIAAMGGILLVWLLRSSIAFTELPNSFIYNNTLTRVDGLLLGAFLAWLDRYHASSLPKLRIAACVIGIAACLAFVVPMIAGFSGGGRDTTYGRLVLYSASVFGGGAIVVSLIGEPQKSFTTIAFSNAVLRSFGKYSYAIYVFNKPILFGLATISNVTFGKLTTAEFGAAFAFASIVCWLAGWLSWHCVERPFLALKKHFQIPSSPSGIEVLRNPKRLTIKKIAAHSELFCEITNEFQSNLRKPLSFCL